MVARYISLERITEESKESYYDSLASSSHGWHEDAHDLIPWWDYSLYVIRKAYAEFAAAAEASGGMTAGKSAMVRRFIDDQIGPFTLAEMKALLPSVSAQLIKRVFQKMKAAGEVQLTGRGRGAKWEKA